MHSDYALKSSFIRNLFLWMKLLIDVGTMPLINFDDWLGSRYERGIVFCILSVWMCTLVLIVYIIFTLKR